jgi:HD-like signal output (HDOD) protein
MEATISVERLTEAANRLEGLPTSLTRMAAIVSSPDFSMDEVVEVIGFDPVLTASLLRAANSAASGASREISTVREAVVRLGASSVSALAVGTTVGNRFRRASQDTNLWRHSVASTMACDVITGRSRAWIPAAAATAALLHDVGKLVLAEALTPNILNLLQTVAKSENLTEHEAERAVLMVDHGELGAIAARAWALPQIIVDGIALHHADAASSFDFAVQLANSVAHSMESESVELPAAGAAGPLEALGLGVDDYVEIVLTTRSRWEKLAEAYGAHSS